MIERDIFTPENILTIISTIPVFAIPFADWLKKQHGDKVGWKCEDPFCSKKFQDGWMMEFDHKIPVSKGGPDTEDNCQLLCQRHHALKHFEAGEWGAAQMIQSRVDATKGGHTRKWLEEHEDK